MTAPVGLPEPSAQARSRPAGTRLSYGWVIVASLGVTEAVSYGVLWYAFAVLMPFMRADLGWDPVTLTLPYTIAIVISGLAAGAVGPYLDGHSPRLPMTAGSLLAAVMVVLWSRVTTPIEMAVVFAGLGAAMSLVLYEPAFIVVTHWFDADRRTALAALTTIAAFSSLIFSPFTSWLASEYGWRAALVALGFVLAVVTVPIHGFVLRPRPDPTGGKAERRPVERRPVERRPSRRRPVPAPAVETDRHAALRSTSFWLLVACFSLSSFATAAMSVHLIPMLMARGSTPAFAALAAGLMGVCQIPGRIAFPLATRLLGTPRTICLLFLAIVISLGVLLGGLSATGVFAAVGVFGACNGMLTLLRASLIADLFGRANYGAIAGVASFFVLASFAAAPLVASAVAGTSGGYASLLAGLVVTSNLAGAAGWLATRMGNGQRSGRGSRPA